MNNSILYLISVKQQVVCVQHKDVCLQTKFLPCGNTWLYIMLGFFFLLLLNGFSSLNIYLQRTILWESFLGTWENLWRNQLNFHILKETTVCYREMSNKQTIEVYSLLCDGKNDGKNNQESKEAIQRLESRPLDHQGGIYVKPRRKGSGMRCAMIQHWNVWTSKKHTSQNMRYGSFLNLRATWYRTIDKCGQRSLTETKSTNSYWFCICLSLI